MSPWLDKLSFKTYAETDPQTGPKGASESSPLDGGL